MERSFFEIHDVDVATPALSVDPATLGGKGGDAHTKSFAICVRQDIPDYGGYIWLDAHSI